MKVIWLLFFVKLTLSLRLSTMWMQQSCKRDLKMSGNSYRHDRRLRTMQAVRAHTTMKPRAPEGAIMVDNGEIRLNKCIPSLSRRAADAAIKEGKVTVNAQIATCGTRVNFGDIVRYEGKIQSWESSAIAKEEQPHASSHNRKLTYIKYWKPVGVTCTSDPNDRSNIISAGGFHHISQRLFSVGRLDKESSGLILLTSDGRVNNAMLNKRCRKEKVYLVEFDRAPSEDLVEKLRNGVMITTPLQRDKSGGKAGSRCPEVTAMTLPCKIRRDPRNDRVLEFTLIEGRNRQIRRMAEAMGLNIVRLHRTSFAGITLKGLSPGDWLELTAPEMAVVQGAMAMR